MAQVSRTSNAITAPMRRYSGPEVALRYASLSVLFSCSQLHTSSWQQFFTNYYYCNEINLEFTSKQNLQAHFSSKCMRSEWVSSHSPVVNNALNYVFGGLCVSTVNDLKLPTSFRYLLTSADAFSPLKVGFTTNSLVTRVRRLQG